MADRKVTVLNPAGYQEQLPDTDNLLLTLLPTSATHAANKSYVDSEVTDLLNDITNTLATDYVAKTGDIMTGKLSWKNDTDAETAYIERIGDAFFQNVDINFNLSSGSAQFGGTVTCDLGLDVDGDVTIGGDISATNGDFTGNLTFNQATVDQINLTNSNGGANGFINNQNFQVSDVSLSIANLTGPVNISGTTVTTTGQTFVNTSLHVGDATDKVEIGTGNIDASGDLSVGGDIDGGNNLDIPGSATMDVCNVTSFVNCNKTVFVGTDADKKIEVNGLTGEIGGGADCFIDGGTY